MLHKGGEALAKVTMGVSLSGFCEGHRLHISLMCSTGMSELDLFHVALQDCAPSKCIYRQVLDKHKQLPAPLHPPVLALSKQ
jgi:hypothetical protein